MTNRELIDVVLLMYRHCEPRDACPEMGCEPCEEALNDIIEALSVDIVKCGECALRKKNKFCLEHMRYEKDDYGYCHHGERRSDG